MGKYQIVCPKCKRGMWMQTNDPSKARKKCVFCGNTFPIRSTIVNGDN